jgi:tetraacyldisaccharide 4'-kinase
VTHSDLYDLLSGKERGPRAAILRIALRVASIFYALGVRSRNWAFDHGWKKIERAPLPVISLGNVTAGGTGKTPLAAFVARRLRERGLRVCFISRGFGAGEKGTNDEALVLDALCPDVPHLQNPDRVAAARIAHEELDSQLIILDDGFQHRRLARDLDIVLVDATNPWGFGRLLPRGLLREPVSSLRRADLIVITRVDQAPRDRVDAIRREILRIHPQGGIAEATFPPVRLINSAGAGAALDSLGTRSIAAFCGIGNPPAFRASLEKLGWHVAEVRSYPDHHNYTRADIEDLERWCRGLPVEAVVCTQKDLVKIGLGRLGERPLWAVEIGVEIVLGRDMLEICLQGLPPDKGLSPPVPRD